MAKETFDRNKPFIGQVAPPVQNVTGITFDVLAGAYVTARIGFDGGDSADYVWLIAMAPEKTTGVTSISKSEFRLICTVENVGLVGVMNIVTPVTARYGVVTAGAKIFLSIYQVHTLSGQKWKMGEFTTVVTGS